MGYATRFTLRAELMIGGMIAELRDNSPPDALIAVLRWQNEEAKYCLGADASTQGSGKWYEHQEDLRAFSRDNPGVLRAGPLVRIAPVKRYALLDATCRADP